MDTNFVGKEELIRVDRLVQNANQAVKNTFERNRVAECVRYSREVH